MGRLLRIKLVRLQPEHARSRDGVQVQALAIGFRHHVVIGNVRHHPQLELRVVRDDELLARWCNEDRTKQFRLGDVLHVGVGAGETPAFRFGELKASVQPARLRVDSRRAACPQNSSEAARGARTAPAGRRPAHGRRAAANVSPSSISCRWACAASLTPSSLRWSRRAVPARRRATLATWRALEGLVIPSLAISSFSVVSSWSQALACFASASRSTRDAGELHAEQPDPPLHTDDSATSCRPARCLVSQSAASARPQV